MCPFCVSEDAVSKVENILCVYLSSYDYSEVVDKLFDAVYKTVQNGEICDEHAHRGVQW